MGRQLYFYCIVLTMVGCSTKPQDNNNEKTTSVAVDMFKEKEAVKATLVAMWDAVEKGDFGGYATFIHPNFTQFGEYDSSLRIGKEAELAGMRTSMQKSSDVHTEMIDPRVTINGDVAWITYYWSDSGISNGESFATHGKSTRIFIKENNKWFCIHGHYTLLPVNIK